MRRLDSNNAVSSGTNSRNSHAAVPKINIQAFAQSPPSNFRPRVQIVEKQGTEDSIVMKTNDSFDDAFETDNKKDRVYDSYHRYKRGWDKQMSRADNPRQSLLSLSKSYRAPRDDMLCSFYESVDIPQDQEVLSQIDTSVLDEITKAEKSKFSNQ